MHSLVVILGPPFFFSLCCVSCLLDLNDFLFLYLVPFFAKVYPPRKFLGKGAWEVKILRLYSWSIGNLESVLKIIFPYNFKCHAPLSYSIHYSCENSDTGFFLFFFFLHGACFNTLEAFISFFSPPTLFTPDTSWWCVGFHSFMLMGTWLGGVCHFVGLSTSILGNFLFYLFDNFLSSIFFILSFLNCYYLNVGPHRLIL